MLAHTYCSTTLFKGVLFIFKGLASEENNDIAEPEVKESEEELTMRKKELDISYQPSTPRCPVQWW